MNRGGAVLLDRPAPVRTQPREVKLLDRLPRNFIRDPELRRMAALAAPIRATMGATTAPLSSQTQKLTIPANATSNAQGAATFTFQAVPQGFTWTGTLTCGQAPATALFQASVGADQYGQWGANSVAGPVQVDGPSQLVVAATGLQPNTDYLLYWSGSSDPTGSAAPAWPDANSSAQLVQNGPGTILLPLTTGIASGHVTTIQAVPNSVRTLILQLGGTDGFSSVSNVTVTGGTTGIQYYNQAPYLLFNSVAITYLMVIPVPGLIESTLTVTVTGVGPYSMELWGDTALYPESVFYNGDLTGSSASTAGSGTLLSGPERLISWSVHVGNTAGTALITFGGQQLRVDGTDVNAQFTFPPNTILTVAQSVAYTIATAGTVSAVTAYP